MENSTARGTRDEFLELDYAASGDETRKQVKFVKLNIEARPLERVRAFITAL